jgi:hypothetical protein
MTRCIEKAVETDTTDNATAHGPARAWSYLLSLPPPYSVHMCGSNKHSLRAGSRELVELWTQRPKPESRVLRGAAVSVI